MKHSTRTRAILLGMMLNAPVVSAQPVCMSSNYVPGLVQGSSGQFRVTLDTTNSRLHVDIVFNALSATPTAGFLDCCTVALPAAVDLGSNFYGATGEFTGDYDLTLAQTWDSTFLAQNQGSTQAATTALATGLSGSQVYGNVTTAKYPQGELTALLQSICP
jgi:hypothetical protein